MSSHFEFSVSFGIRLQDILFVYRLNCIVFIIFLFSISSFFLLPLLNSYSRWYEKYQPVLDYTEGNYSCQVMPTTHFYAEAQKLICGFTLNWSQCTSMSTCEEQWLEGVNNCERKNEFLKTHKEVTVIFFHVASIILSRFTCNQNNQEVTWSTFWKMDILEIFPIFFSWN